VLPTLRFRVIVRMGFNRLLLIDLQSVYNLGPYRFDMEDSNMLKYASNP